MATCRRPSHCVAAAAVYSVWLLLHVQAFDWNWGTPTAKKHATDDLVSGDFAAFLEDHPVTAILFYAPWCFYSQQVMPAWDLAAQKLKLHDPPVHLAKIDAHKFWDIGEKYGVTAFPTMKLFVDGTIFEYDSHSGRGWQHIVKWVNRHIERDHVLKGVEDVDHYLHDNDLNVVGLFPDGHNSSSFGKSARHFEDVMFAEARGTKVSEQIAESLARHAHLVCETIDLGQSKNRSKEVELPREDMHCTGTPRNPQRADWTDTFEASVKGKQLTVRRSDSDGGWEQLLQVRCCDDENSKAIKEKQLQKINVPSVVMFMPHDERFAIYDGDIEDTKELDRWISARRTPMVMRLTPETAELILDSGPEKMPVLFLISPGTQNLELEKQMREAAKQLRGRIIVCFSGLGSQIEKRFAELAGVDGDVQTTPIVTLIEAHPGGGPRHSVTKYRLAVEGLKAPTIVQFITDYEQGRLKPWLRSEPEPSAEDLAPDGVTVLVGSTFKALTQDDTTKDVLVDFYAPWCGHCRKFEPNYKALARSLRHVKTLRIAKIDATRNEVEGLSINGFPTIILFPATAKPHHQIVYQGSRQPEDLTRWLQDHCSFKFSSQQEAQPVDDQAESGLLDGSEEDL